MSPNGLSTPFLQYDLSSITTNGFPGSLKKNLIGWSGGRFNTLEIWEASKELEKYLPNLIAVIIVMPFFKFYFAILFDSITMPLSH